MKLMNKNEHAEISMDEETMFDSVYESKPILLGVQIPLEATMYLLFVSWPSSSQTVLCKLRMTSPASKYAISNSRFHS